MHKVARSADVHPAKMAKLEDPPAASNIVVQFQSDSGDIVGAERVATGLGGTISASLTPIIRPSSAAGPQLDLPQGTSPDQLETLLNGLLDHDSQRLPYLFYVNDRPLSDSLGKHLVEHKVGPSFAIFDGAVHLSLRRSSQSLLMYCTVKS